MKDDYLDSLGRTEAEVLLARFKAGTLTQEQARDELVKVWVIAARPGVLLSPSEWRDLWQFAGHVHLYRNIRGGPVQWVETDRPSTPVLLYRCANDEFKTNPSWTESEEQARTWSDVDPVWIAEFAPERLLATVNIKPNDETEYIAYAEELDLRIHLRRRTGLPPSAQCTGPIQ